MNQRKYNLLTYDEAVDICAAAGDLIFYEAVSDVQGFKVCTFNYRLARYEDFVLHQAWELRGLTFVFNTDGTVYRRFPLLNKFFNLNQVEETQHELIKDKPFDNVYYKEDGSVISFIELPNKTILAKSKMQVDNQQAEMAQKIYDKTPSIQSLVTHCLANDLVPIFELVSPSNRIVLKYATTELILLRIRDGRTGEYVDIDSLGASLLANIKRPQNMTGVFMSWDDMVGHIDNTTDQIEGYVVQHTDGQMVKIKTAWYCALHHTMTNVLAREDYLIELILEEKIDDVMPEIAPDDVEVLALVERTTFVVRDYIDRTTKRVHALVANYTDDKSFAAMYLKDPVFHYAVRYANGGDLYEDIKKEILKRTHWLNVARSFIETGILKEDKGW